MKKTAILIPTYNRSAGLAVTLTSLCSQNFRAFDVIISDQSDEPVKDVSAVIAAKNVLEYHGSSVSFCRNLPRRGMAQQRQFLLDQTESKFILFLDDDVILEPWAIETMLEVIKKEKCGLAGMFVIGLSYKNDVRPEDQKVEFWEGPVEPETIRPGSKKWQRASLHSAANVLHTAEKFNITPDNPRIYKIAWLGGCKLYDKQKLVDAGGFEFWRNLPEEHAGEDVMAQLNVIESYGGCGILPSGAYHQELETTVPNRDVDAVDLLLNKK